VSQNFGDEQEFHARRRFEQLCTRQKRRGRAVEAPVSLIPHCDKRLDGGGSNRPNERALPRV